ncbi:hypothetical protein KY332_01390 [Candidatus Woesearchaeota archaeon]|nr:hypothetical protein [Candidatus Woesearchaeota archaeon]
MAEYKTINLDNIAIERRAYATCSKEVVKGFYIMPIKFLDDNTIVVAVRDNLKEEKLETLVKELSFHLKKDVCPVLATKKQIKKAHKRYYKK